RQFRIHRRIRDIEDVGCDRNVVQRGPAQSRELLHQRNSRIERRAGKRAEAGDEDTKGRRHGRACPGHPHLAFGSLPLGKTWMPGTQASETPPFFELLRPSMTIVETAQFTAAVPRSGLLPAPA